MTEREEIINSLNACMDVHRSGLWSSGCAFCSYAKRSNPKCFMDLTKDAVALLREQPVKDTNVPSKWISVKDRLPDDASDVLAYYDCGDSGHVMFVNYYKNCWYDFFNDLIDDLDQGCITHWMPLPEPPEESNHETINH